MTSPTPLLYDTYYHIFNRGNNRENLFAQQPDYLCFLDLFTKYVDPVAETFAYCLLRNHFHLLLRIKSEEEVSRLTTLQISSASKTGNDFVSRQFSRFFNAYIKHMNQVYGRTGSLFEHPFHRVMVKSDRQFWRVVAYIHQNPQKHRFTRDFREWKWSSYQGILSDQPTRLQREEVLAWFGGKDQYVELNSQWVKDAEAKWFSGEDED